MINKIFLSFLFLSVFMYGQEKKDAAIVNWIDNNAITIENTDQDYPMTILKDRENGLFKNVRVFGFGEATHNGKEFFELKAKFFKYLAQNEGVRLFMMEDCYSCDEEVNTFIAGGEGNARAMAAQLGYGLWRTEEMAELIQWMRNFNKGKTFADQIKFSGIDNGFPGGLNRVVKSFMDKYQIGDNGIPNLVDYCVRINYVQDYKNEKLIITQDELVKAQQILTDSFKPINAEQIKELDVALHALTLLKQYCQYCYYHSPAERDKDMADNVLWNLKHEGPQSKGFVWAHNAHISKAKKRSDYAMGGHLKNALGDGYYSMGFVLGSGQVYQMSFDKKYGKVNTIAEPYKGNYAEVLNKAKADIFFIDIKQAFTNTSMKAFLESNRTVIDAGAHGYNPKFKGSKEDLPAKYDGIIYTRYISLPNYIKGSVPDVLIIKE